MTTPATNEEKRRAIEGYISMRNRVKMLKKANNDEIADLESRMKTLENFLRMQMGEGVSSIPTDAGTAYLSKTDYVSVTDWPLFLDFICMVIAHEASSGDAAKRDALIPLIRDSSAWTFFNQAVKKSTVMDFMKAYDDRVPEGLTYGSEQTLKVKSN